MTTHIIIPSYNCGAFLQRCLDSVQKQADVDFKVVLIDDASTDEEHQEVAKHYCDQHGWMLLTNEHNMKAPYTIKQGIEASGAAADDIILLLDGDDFLLYSCVYYLESIYRDWPGIWLTYGNYQSYPGETGQAPATEYPTLVRWNRDFRNDLMRYNHPLSFRRFLFDALDDADLQDDNGNWFTDGYDQVIMAPMLEMAGPDHYACLTEIVYYYNTDNPISDALMIAENKRTPLAWQIRSRPKKAQLQRPAK